MTGSGRMRRNSTWKRACRCSWFVLSSAITRLGAMLAVLKWWMGSKYMKGWFWVKMQNMCLSTKRVNINLTTKPSFEWFPSDSMIAWENTSRFACACSWSNVQMWICVIELVQLRSTVLALATMLREFACWCRQNGKMYCEVVGQWSPVDGNSMSWFIS